MRVLVDTSVWSLALRRSARSLSPAEQRLTALLRELIHEGRAAMVGPVRQEILAATRTLVATTRILAATRTPVATTRISATTSMVVATRGVLVARSRSLVARKGPRCAAGGSRVGGASLQQLFAS